MPYIPEERRANPDLTKAGDLTYALYKIALEELGQEPNFEKYCFVMEMFCAVEVAFSIAHADDEQMLNGLTGGAKRIMLLCDNSGCDLFMGAIQCAKMEFYRRKVAAYEDEKIFLNGDVTWSK